MRARRSSSELVGSAMWDMVLTGGWEVEKMVAGDGGKNMRRNHIELKNKEASFRPFVLSSFFFFHAFLYRPDTQTLSHLPPHKQQKKSETETFFTL